MRDFRQAMARLVAAAKDGGMEDDKINALLTEAADAVKAGEEVKSEDASDDKKPTATATAAKPAAGAAR